MNSNTNASSTDGIFLKFRFPLPSNKDSHNPKSRTLEICRLSKSHSVFDTEDGFDGNVDVSLALFYYFLYSTERAKMKGFFP
jgi:hypothetical protein